MYWKSIGEWWYPTKENSSFTYVFYHKPCAGRFAPSTALFEEKHLSFDHCSACNKKVPDGFKMIALLEKL